MCNFVDCARLASVRRSYHIDTIQIDNRISNCSHAQQEDLFKKVIAHCKEYGFVFPSSEIYDGLGAVYDYGQLGSELKNNIKRYWWEAMTLLAPNA